MAKKMNQAERIAAMLDEEKVKEYIAKHTLYHAVLVGGTKSDGEEKVIYRCAHCRHEWEKAYQNYYARVANTLVCPKCRKRMFPARTLPQDRNQYSNSLQLYDGVQIRNFRYILYVDAAMFDETPGIILSEYEPSVMYEYSDVPESFTVKLELSHYGFVSASHKLLFNADGTKTTKFLYNAFCGWNCINVASDAALLSKADLPWMEGYSNFEGNSWLNAFDTYWARRDTGTRKPLGELHAEQTLEAFDIPDFPEIEITASQIVSRDVSEDVITGKHHMEYCCLSCGARFSAETAYSRSNVECPECGLSTGRESRLVVGCTYEDVGIISMLNDNTILLRAGKITCSYDENFAPSYARQELYRAIIELNPNGDPKVHFLVNEGHGDKIVWVKKKNYASSKFYYSIKQLEYFGELDALKYTGLREFIEYKIQKSPYSHSVPIDVSDYRTAL